MPDGTTHSSDTDKPFTYTTEQLTELQKLGLSEKEIDDLQKLELPLEEVKQVEQFSIKKENPLKPLVEELRKPELDVGALYLVFKDVTSNITSILSATRMPADQLLPFIGSCLVKTNLQDIDYAQFFRVSNGLDILFSEAESYMYTVVNSIFTHMKEKLAPNLNLQPLQEESVKIGQALAITKPLFNFVGQKNISINLATTLFKEVSLQLKQGKPAAEILKSPLGQLIQKTNEWLANITKDDKNLVGETEKFKNEANKLIPQLDCPLSTKQKIIVAIATVIGAVLGAAMGLALGGGLGVVASAVSGGALGYHLTMGFFQKGYRDGIKNKFDQLIGFKSTELGFLKQKLEKLKEKISSLPGPIRDLYESQQHANLEQTTGFSRSKKDHLNKMEAEISGKVETYSTSIKELLSSQLDEKEKEAVLLIRTIEQDPVIREAEKMVSEEKASYDVKTSGMDMGMGMGMAIN
jgi:hypothetical protein